MEEIWRDSPTAVGAQVSNIGRFMVKPYHREMPYGGTRLYGGFPWRGTIAWDASRPRLVTRHRGRTFKLHRLICEAFHGPEPFENADVLHLNGNTLENREDNLRWATRAEVLAQPPVDLEFLKQFIEEMRCV